MSGDEATAGMGAMTATDAPPLLPGGAAAEGCGCVSGAPHAEQPPRTGSIESAPERTPAEMAPQPSQPAPPLQKGLKLVVSVHGQDGAGLKVLLGAGAEGCDPELRLVVAPDLSTALAELPSLLAEAEARWSEHPRYPAARPGSAARGQVPAARPQMSTPQAQIGLFDLPSPPAGPDGPAPTAPEPAQPTSTPKSEEAF